MSRFALIVASLLIATSAWAADIYTAKGLKDVYFGEALYHAYQGDWFQSIARLDMELGQHRRVDEPGLDPLYQHLNQAQFGVGDFELGYRMHLRAGRAITAVIEGNVEEPVRNDAIYRLARLYFQKDQPQEALHALERIHGTIPPAIRDDVAFLRGQILLANGRFPEAARVFKDLEKVNGFEGFAGYNQGIALLKEGKEQDGRELLNRAGQIATNTPATLAIKDKSNLVLGYKLLNEKAADNAKLLLERVRLSGPFSNRALLGSGWADVARGQYDRALVPWTILAEREVTDAAVQEALLAVPYAYGKLNIYGKAALLYGKALDAFGKEVEKLGASITSVQEGKFLQALAREELKQDPDWVVKLRSLPQAPETYYLLELMASHDFQESLKNYFDLHELQTKLGVWERDLDAFEDMIGQRRAYYQPLIPEIDRKFKELDSQIRLRTEQRIRIEKRMHALLTAPRPDDLTTGEERVAKEKIARLQQALAGGVAASDAMRERISRLQGVLLWNIATEYDQRLTDAYKDLRDLKVAVERLQKQYDTFVRTRQAATQSYQGYDEVIRQQRDKIAAAREKVKVLMARQGNVLEIMAVEELTKRRQRLEQFQVKARFAIADSYDRASRAQAEPSVGPQAEKSSANNNQTENGTGHQAEKNTGDQAEKSVAK